MFTLQELLCAPPAWHSFTTVLLSVMTYLGVQSDACVVWDPHLKRIGSFCMDSVQLFAMRMATRVLGGKLFRLFAPNANYPHCRLDALILSFCIPLIDIVLLISSLTANISSAFCQVYFSSVEQFT